MLGSLCPTIVGERYIRSHPTNYTGKFGSNDGELFPNCTQDHHYIICRSKPGIGGIYRQRHCSSDRQYPNEGERRLGWYSICGNATRRRPVTLVMGILAERVGRRRGFTLGLVTGVLGAGLASIAIVIGEVWSVRDNCRLCLGRQAFRSLKTAIFNWFIDGKWSRGRDGLNTDFKGAASRCQD